MEYVHSFLREKDLQEEFETLMRYYEQQWKRRVGPNSISFYKRVRRTNNDSESFHASLQRLLRVRGPNVWEFTDGLRSITGSIVRERAAFIDEGLSIRSLTKRQYRINNQRIRNATALFDENQNVGEFLSMVCYTTEGIVQVAISGETDDDQENEEHLLGPLEPDVPLQYVTLDTTELNQEDAEGTEEVGESDNAEGAEVVEPESEEVAENVESHTEERNIAVCMICHTAPPTTVLLPCNHFGLCDQCCAIRQELNAVPPQPEDLAYDNVVDHSICPLDRIRVTQYLRVVTT